MQEMPGDVIWPSLLVKLFCILSPLQIQLIIYLLLCIYITKMYFLRHKIQNKKISMLS